MIQTRENEALARKLLAALPNVAPRLRASFATAVLLAVPPQVLALKEEGLDLLGSVGRNAPELLEGIEAEYQAARARAK